MRLERELRDTHLILTRVATDTGARTTFDEAIAAFGFSRADLETELEADLAAGSRAGNSWSRRTAP
jgi:hypothetical protein